MKALESLIPQNVAEAIGATFMHAIWQLAAVALLLLLAYQVVPRKSSRMRYHLGVGALALMLVLPIVTFGLYYTPASPVLPSSPNVETMLSTGQFQQLDAALQAQESQNAFLPGVSEFFNANAPLLFSLWMLGAMVFTFRFLGSYIYVQRLRRRDTLAVPAVIHEKLEALKTKLGITRTVQLLQSTAVDTPMVIGVLRPVVLLPVGLLSGLSPEQVQCILAHELAHIRRWDYLVNIFQSMVEICLFFHPAVWWVSKMVREERENCCDETVLALKNNSMVYAKALLNLEVIRTRKPGLAMASNGGSLFKRIKRITGAEIRETRIYSRSLFVGLLTLTFIVLLSTTGTDSIKASAPLFNLSAPELEWEQDPPQTDVSTHVDIDMDSNKLAFVTEPVEAKSAFLYPEGNPEHLFPMTAYLSFAKEAVQTVPVREAWTEVEHLGHQLKGLKNILGNQLHGIFSRDAIVQLDTPVSKIILMENGEEIEIAMDMDGNIESVEVDGKAVPESEYAQYESMANQTMRSYLRRNRSQMPAPPVPPNMGNMGAPPVPPHMGKLPPAPQPPKMGKMPVPPAPPARGNMSDEEYERAMEAFGEEMEHWGDRLERHVESADWDKFERDMERWGEKLEAHFDSKDWSKFERDMEAWAEGFSEQFEEQDWEAFGEEMEEWGESFGAQMEELGERIANEVERSLERSDRSRERRREMADRELDRAERMRERAEERADRYRNRAERYRNGVDNIQESLEDDNLIRRGNSYKVRINEDELYINGKRRSSAMQRKYKRIIERSLGIEIDNEWVEINQKKRSTKTKISN